MRVFVLFMLLIIIAAFAAFVSLNHGIIIESVSLGFTIIHDITLNMLIVWTFAIGVFWALLIFSIQEIRLRLRISRMRQSMRELQRELDQLRIIPLSDNGIGDKEGK